MAKHKEIEMWAAGIHEDWKPDGHGRTVQTYCGRVVETPKQYRIVRDLNDERQASFMRCCGYKSNIDKKANIWLHCTELEALKALDKRLGELESRASTRAAIAQENLFLITRALEEYHV